MSQFNLFIYDRLLRHPLLDECEHIAEATLGGILYDVDAGTALLLYGAAPVRGRVVRCPAAMLQRLDAAQSVGEGLFRRVGAEAVTVSGDLVPCWVYTAGPALSRQLLPDRRIAG